MMGSDKTDSTRGVVQIGTAMQARVRRIYHASGGASQACERLGIGPLELNNALGSGVVSTEAARAIRDALSRVGDVS
jgi:hypothetical protein